MYEQALSEYGVAMAMGAAIAVVLLRHHAVFISDLHRAEAHTREERLMFPTPSSGTSPWVQRTYKVLLPVALFICSCR